MEKTLKNWLKKIKLSEPSISTILGGLVIVIVGILIFNYFKAGQVGEVLLEEPLEGKVEFIETEEGRIPEGLPLSHRVEQGENLWEISERYYTSGYNWVDIMAENNLVNPDYLEVDQELKLPIVPVRELVRKVVQVSNPITSDAYKVEKGDSLWKIAVRAYGDGYKWLEIAQANNLVNPNYIEVDQELKLPR